MKENYQIYLPSQFHWRPHSVGGEPQLPHKKMKTLFLSNMSKSPDNKKKHSNGHACNENSSKNNWIPSPFHFFCWPQRKFFITKYLIGPLKFVRMNLNCAQKLEMRWKQVEQKRDRRSKCRYNQNGESVRSLFRWCNNYSFSF